MAVQTEQCENMDLLIIHGADRHKINISLTDDDKVLCVHHLAKNAEEVTGVPVQKQKLIYKGKSLSDPSMSLTSLGLKNGAKVMLLGKKFDEVDEEFMKKMNTVEVSMTKLQKKLDEIAVERSGASQGFLDKSMQLESYNKLQKQVLVVSEDLTRLLEKLDGFVLQDAAAGVKKKRKSLVTNIQALLNRCDSEKSLLNNSLSKLC